MSDTCAEEEREAVDITARLSVLGLKVELAENSLAWARISSIDRTVLARSIKQYNFCV